MTNEEIREKYITEQGGDFQKQRWNLQDKNVDEIQIETRKSERERVIGEIENFLYGYQHPDSEKLCDVQSDFVAKFKGK